MLTKEYILDCLAKYAHFSEDLCSGNFYENIVAPIEKSQCFDEYDWVYDSGISKGVFIFDELDYVIKIPFQSNWYEDGECWDDEQGTYVPCDGWVGEPFCGNEVEGFVKNHDWDYCETEELLYKVAERNGIAEYFAQTTYIGDVRGWPIYAQTRACMFRSESSRTARSQKNYSKAQRDSANELMKRNHFYVDEEWLIDFITYYGEQALLTFIKFCDDWFISDLHSGNLGYVDGVPCLVDYSSFDN